MNIKKIRKLNIPSGTMRIVWTNKHNGGSVSYHKAVIEIGCKAENPDMMLDTIIHEISEIAHIELHQRFYRPDCDGDYLFSFNHAGHASHSGLVAGMLKQFIG